jgi:hypothetical protein
MYMYGMHKGYSNEITGALCCFQVVQSFIFIITKSNLLWQKN